MKIAFFSDCYLDLTGGIRSSINAQKNALESLGHTVYVFSSGFPKTEKEIKKLARDHIYQVPSCKLFFRGLTPVSRRPSIVEEWLLREHPEIKEFDVFYTHYEAGCSIAGLRLGRRLGIPIIQVMHGREDVGESSLIPFGFRTIVARLLNWFHSWYLPHSVTVPVDNYLATTKAKAKMWTMMVNHANYADLVLTPSAHFRKKLLHYGVKNEIKVLPNGVSDQHFPKNPVIKEFKDDDALQMIWHSRVSEEKRIMPFLKALRYLKGDYILNVFGDGNDFMRAKNYALKQNLNVVFHGNTDYQTLAAKLPESHLDILVSYNYDTFGMTLIEAESYGVPVFFCDPDMKEVVPEGSYLLSAHETPESMAKAINKVFDNPELIQKMSKIMLEHREEVLISNRIHILEKIINDIIKS